MSFKGSFGDADFVKEENPNNISLGEEDIKKNLTIENSEQKNTETKCFINNEISIPSNSNNNIFCSVPMEMELEEENSFQNMEINNENNNNNSNEDNGYMELLIKELLKYNLGNLFNILNDKKTIIKSNTFYFLKKLYKFKINKIIKAQILFLKISSKLDMLSKIFQRHRINNLYQVFYIIQRKYIPKKDTKENSIINNFRAKFEQNYTKEKNNIINQNNNSIKSLQIDIQTLKKNINQLTTKESELKSEIYNYLQEEKQLNEKIKNIESVNNSIKKSIQSSNSSSIKTISKTEILSLENAIKASKQLKEEKEEIINIFMNKVNDLLNEYQVYLDNLKTLDLSGSNMNNNMNIEFTSSSNLQSIKQKDTTENSLFFSKFSVKNQSNEI